MRSLIFSLLAACGPGVYQLDTPSRFEACVAASCPMAIGGTVYVQATLATDVEELVPLQAVSVEPPSLAAVELHDDYFLVRPASAGTGTLRATLRDGRLMERRLRVAAVAATAIVVPELPDGTSDFALLAGSTLGVYAEHRDAAGDLLLGDGLDAWRATGGTVVEDRRADPAFEDDLGRAIIATDPAQLVISAGPGSTLAVDVAPLGSTRELVLVEQATNHIALGANELRAVEVRAFDPQHRLLIGGAPLTLEVADPTLVTATPHGRSISLEGRHAVGDTEVIVHFDGSTLRVMVTVHR